MGKKIDLKKPKQTKTHNNKKHSYRQYNIVPQDNNGEQAEGTNIIQKKGAEIAMRSVGVPKELAKKLANDERTYQLADKANVTIKMPKMLKVAIPIILVLLPFLGLMIFVVLFADTDSSSGGAFAYGETCPTITVTDTGCNRNAQECTHVYDGEVSFEDYIAGVIAAEHPYTKNLEFYKVLAIAARTFFIGHSDSSCTVSGNAGYQAYRSVDSLDDSEDIALIKQAVEETTGLVMIKNNKPVKGGYAAACVVTADEEFYHISYGSESIGTANIQKIPKEWDKLSTRIDPYKGNLSYWLSLRDQSLGGLKICPLNHNYGMSQLGALYLITAENYSFEETLKFYYGEDIEILENEMQLNGANGFVNPTRVIHCTSPFGPRIHPVSGKQSTHTGLDIGISGGEPIFAAADGIIIDVKTTVNSINNCNYGYGNYVQIDHGNGISTLYAHIKYGSIPSSIEKGAQVSQGEQIGEVGSTGCSTGNHLHYEVRKNGSQVDPADYIDLTGATGTCRR